MFDPSLETPLERASLDIGIQKEWLRNVINLESSWRHDAYNPSGAVGLIQFMPRTLKDMRLLSPALDARIPSEGTVPADVKQAVKAEFLAKFPSAVAQLAGPVSEYMKRYRPFPTEQSAYMAVFYPAFRYVAPTTPFPEVVRRANPGIDTVGDYLTAVKKKSQAKETWGEKLRRWLGFSPEPPPSVTS